jgi:hypothetical protein
VREVVELKNCGVDVVVLDSAAGSLTLAGPQAEDFVFAVSQPLHALLPGDSIAIMLQYRPHSATSSNARLNVTSSGGTVLAVVNVSGTGDVSGFPGTPDTLDFANVPAGVRATRRIWWKNSSPRSLDVRMIQGWGRFSFVPADQYLTVRPGDSLWFDVTALPDSSQVGQDFFGGAAFWWQDGAMMAQGANAVRFRATAK